MLDLNRPDHFTGVSYAMIGQGEPQLFCKVCDEDIVTRDEIAACQIDEFDGTAICARCLPPKQPTKQVCTGCGLFMWETGFTCLTCGDDLCGFCVNYRHSDGGLVNHIVPFGQ